MNRGKNIGSHPHLTRTGPRLTANILKEQIASFLMSRDNEGIVGYEVMYGSSRRVADMVFISKGYSYAIEIKSEFDTLMRLDGQMQDYQTLFDYILVFSAPKHLGAIKPFLPDFVGLYSISDKGIQRIQREKKNQYVQKTEMLFSIPSVTIKTDFSVKGKLTSDEIRKVVKAKPFKTIHAYFINYFIGKITKGVSHHKIVEDSVHELDTTSDYIIN